MENILPKIEKRYLRYDFSAVEVHDLSMSMANKTQEFASIEGEKKAITSQFSSKLNILKESINSLADKVASGYEMREVECDIQYHKPEQGKKTYIRKDTGAKIVEKMDSSDFNLWNQYNEEENEPVLKQLPKSKASKK
jgi:hypothetical protein